MTFSLNDLTQLVTTACVPLLPGGAPEVSFLPLLDATLGDIGCDVLKRIASVRRVPPVEISGPVLATLKNSGFGEFQVVDDFLNIRLSDEVLLHRWSYDALESLGGRIVVPPRKRSLDPVGYARVVASATVQWFLRGERAEISSEAGTLTFPCSYSDLQLWFSHTTDPLVSCDDSESVISARIGAASSVAPVTVWLYPELIGRGHFKSFVSQIREASGGRFTMQCLERDWVGRITEVWSPEAILKMGAQEFSSLLLYLARGGLGSELDLSVPRLQERAHLRWSLSSLNSRLSQIEVNAGLPEPLTEHLGGLERLCLVRARLMSLFQMVAARDGEVACFLGAAEELILAITQYINDPRVWISIDSNEGNFGIKSRAIIAGAKQSISGTINSCLLFQGLELAPT